MSEPIIFYPSQGRAILWTIVSPVLMILGGLGCTSCLDSIETKNYSVSEMILPLGISILFTLVGSISLIETIRLYSVRVIVDSAGVSLLPRRYRGFSITWDEIISWRIVTSGDPEESLIRLERRGRRFFSIIEEHEVARPGFDRLVEAIKRYVPEREASPPRGLFGSPGKP